MSPAGKGKPRAATVSHPARRPVRSRADRDGASAPVGATSTDPQETVPPRTPAGYACTSAPVAAC